ncbi:hypothetical protein EVAR_12549_1 [Eumeta japonica]|uniref:Uncharacterized protein n=1 Tax=Eumeta variegata TaxID=151549 RepID=A0A4C1TPS8_EUMVA|nr:hypothetical protein EVAR_12549_1 [Eumeta japonica]
MSVNGLLANRYLKIVNDDKDSDGRLYVESFSGIQLLKSMLIVWVVLWPGSSSVIATSSSDLTRVSVSYDYPFLKLFNETPHDVQVFRLPSRRLSVNTYVQKVNYAVLVFAVVG